MSGPPNTFAKQYASEAKLRDVGAPLGDAPPNDMDALLKKREELRNPLHALNTSSSRLDKLKGLLQQATQQEVAQVAEILDRMSFLPNELTKRL